MRWNHIVKGDKDNDFALMGCNEWIRTSAHYIAMKSGVKEFKLTFTDSGRSFSDNNKKHISIGRKNFNKLWYGIHIIIHEIAHARSPYRSGHNMIWQDINEKMQNMFGLDVGYMRSPGYETRVEKIGG